MSKAYSSATADTSASQSQHFFNKSTKLKAAGACAGILMSTGFLFSTAQAARVYEQEGTSFDIFGSIQASIGNEHAISQIAHDEFQDSTALYPRAKLGIAGRTSLGTGVDGIMMAQWETVRDHEGRGDESNVLNYTKYMFAGIDAYQYGTLIFGKGDNAFYTVAGATDIFDEVGSYANDYYLLGEQRSSLIMYSLRALSWDLKLSYQFAKDDFGYTPLHVNHGIAASVSTKFGEKITFAYGFDYHQFNYGVNTNETRAFFAPMMAQELGSSTQEATEHLKYAEIDSMTVYGMSLSYGTLGEGLYGAIVVGATDYTNMHLYLYNIDTALNYTFTNGWDLSLGYGYKTYDDITIISDLTLGVGYQFNQAFRIFGVAQFDLGGEADEFYTQSYCNYLRLNEDKFVLGAEFKF